MRVGRPRRPGGIVSEEKRGENEVMDDFKRSKQVFEFQSASDWKPLLK